MLGKTQQGRSYLETSSYFIVQYAPSNPAVSVTELKSSAASSKRSSTEPEEIYKTEDVFMQDGNLFVYINDDQQGTFIEVIKKS